MSKVNARYPRHPIHPTLNKEGDQLARVTWGGEFQQECTIHELVRASSGKSHLRHQIRKLNYSNIHDS